MISLSEAIKQTKTATERPIMYCTEPHKKGPVTMQKRRYGFQCPVCKKMIGPTGQTIVESPTNTLIYQKLKSQ